jgi:hypothetical protein
MVETYGSVPKISGFTRQVGSLANEGSDVSLDRGVKVGFPWRDWRKRTRLERGKDAVG